MNLKKYFYILLPVVLVLSPVLFFGQTFTNADFLYLVLPNLEFYRSSLVAGTSFFWNPNIVSGFPSFFTGGLFSPLNLLAFKFIPAITAYGWVIFVNLGLAGVFTALFLKELKLSTLAQIFGSLIFIFSQWFIAPDLSIVSTFPILPLIFLILLKSYNQSSEAKWTKTAIKILVGGLALGWMFLSAHYNWMMMVLVGAALFALVLGKKTLFSFIGMTVIGGLIGFIQLYPTIIYSNFAARGASALSFVEASVGAFTIWDLPKIYLPYLRLPFVGQAESLLYIGLIPLFFLVIGLAVKNKVARFMTWIFLGSLIIGIKYSPLYWLINKLPVISGFRGPSRWMFLGFFAASVLAAFGLDNYSKIGEWKKPWAKIFVWLGVTVLGLSLAVSFSINTFRSQLQSFLNTFFERNLLSQTSGLPIEHYYQVIDNALNQLVGMFSLSNPTYLFSLIVILLGVIAVYRINKQGDYSIKDKRNLVVLSALSFILIFSFFHPTLAKEAVTTIPETAELISQNPGQNLGKVISFLPGQSEWQKLTVPYGSDPLDSFNFNSTLLAPGTHLLYGLPGADGYENLMPRRQARLLALLGSDRATIGEKLSEADITPEEKAEIFSSRKYLLDLLGVRYITSAYPLSEEVFTKIGEVSSTKHNLPIFVYENKEAKPLVYFAKKVSLLPEDEDIAYQKVVQNDELDVTLLECETCAGLLPLKESEIEIEKLSDSNVQLLTENQDLGLLVFNQNNLPGWRAFIDKVEVPIYTVNSVFMGVVVPAGEHRVEFLYQFSNLFRIYSL